jgi:DNA-binding NtrC family response regulator
MKQNQSIPLPSDSDLRRLIHFSSTDGRIWLAGQRMVLIHTAGLGALRRELITSIGHKHTRRILMRAGYAAGEKDAVLAKQVRQNASLEEMFAVGPQLHMLEGAVQVTPKKLDIDMKIGHYYGLFQWDHSWEVETHVRHFGQQESPVCWMLLGYASGYTSAFMGQPIYYKEVECKACGDEHCLIEGKTLPEWEDGESLAKDYDADPYIMQLEQLRSQVSDLSNELATPTNSNPMIGRSTKFNEAMALLSKAAGTKVTVLLTGETGVGKERFAQTLHNLSPRADKPFIAVNCAALPADLIEAELFGVEKGAYTGADQSRPGRLERADGGTLLLDELGEMPLPVQAKLLRVLQDGVIERLGSTSTTQVNVRVVAATHVDLDAAVKNGSFRQDLYYRLNIYPIHIPSLRERPEDTVLIADHFLDAMAKEHSKALAGFTDLAIDAIKQYPWPGNIRELENLVERGVILSDPGGFVDAKDLFPLSPQQQSHTLDDSGSLQTDRGDHSALFEHLSRHKLSLESMSNIIIQDAVSQSGGNLAAAARSLGMTRPQLNYRLNKAQSNQFIDMD